MEIYQEWPSAEGFGKALDLLKKIGDMQLTGNGWSELAKQSLFCSIESPLPPLEPMNNSYQCETDAAGMNAKKLQRS